MTVKGGSMIQVTKWLLIRRRLSVVLYGSRSDSWEARKTTDQRNYRRQQNWPTTMHRRVTVWNTGLQTLQNQRFDFENVASEDFLWWNTCFFDAVISDGLCNWFREFSYQPHCYEKLWTRFVPMKQPSQRMMQLTRRFKHWCRFEFFLHPPQLNLLAMSSTAITVHQYCNAGISFEKLRGLSLPFTHPLVPSTRSPPWCFKSLS